jgi:2-polyprenyl-3-methyl-5-hydroxy-6-metoxy-1,4-benzoquinol methylase
MSAHTHALDDFGETNRRYNPNRVQYPLALKLFTVIPEGKKQYVLDVGCGFGEFGDLLHDQYPSMQIECVDGADTCYAYMTGQGRKCYQLNVEQDPLPFTSNIFDAVISLEVIEHLHTTQQYLTEIVRVIKPGGFAIFTTPNYNCYSFKVYRHLHQYDKIRDERHQRDYTSKTILEVLQQYFIIIKVLGRYALPLKINVYSQHFISQFASTVGILARKRSPRA